MKHIIIILLLTLGLASSPLHSQRHITPVKPAEPTLPVKKDKKRTDAAIDSSRLQRQTDSRGNIIFIDTVTGREWVDTTAVRANTRMIYPKIYAVSAGINIWDAALRAFGQQYGLLSVWGELNMHNRYFPTLEIGLGQASINSEVPAFTYRSTVSPYFKIGASYNIFYNSDPRYKFLVGLRYCLTPFSYSVPSAPIDDSYWGESGTVTLPSRHSFAGYFEFLAGVRVEIWKNLSLGWDLRFHSMLHDSKNPDGQPIYIPGFGKRGTPLGGSFSISYTFTLNPISPETVVK